jgi:hypothetical protein
MNRTFTFFWLLLFAGAALSQTTGSLRGSVKDEFGASIVGAVVTLKDQAGQQKVATTNDSGIYEFRSIVPGSYKVNVTANGFAAYDSEKIEVAGRISHDITLAVATVQEELTVEAEGPISTEPENNAGALVLRGADLESLPDDPEELAEALRALAGPSAGPNGGQIYIDGFSMGRFPPKESIREIRINSNPFSAEYDNLGYGRIEILTKPGSDKFRGSAVFGFSDESLNSRNPFAPNRAPYQRREYSFDLSGPIVKGKASYFFDFDHRTVDDNDIISATILDDSLNIVPYSLAVLTPQKRMSFSPRIDYQLNQNNTLVGRYSFSKSERLGSGIGEFNLLTHAYDTTSREHSFQLTHTAVVSKSVINETRFQFMKSTRDQDPDNLLPTVRVLDAFISGGSQVGRSLDKSNRMELHNVSTWTRGSHAFRAGARFRRVSISDLSEQNFFGTYTFGGGFGPQLDENNNVVLGADGSPAIIPITSLERYRRTRLFSSLTPAAIRELGGGPTQFTISRGIPESGVTQWDISPFIQDDWRVSPNFTLSLGLRYENQSNIDSNLNFAPRVGFAWALDNSNSTGLRRASTVIRGGFGVFYDRIGENLTLQEIRYNGSTQQQYLITDPLQLNQIGFSESSVNIPSFETLAGFAVPQTRRILASDIQAPYTMQTALSIERQLPWNMSLFTTFISSRTLHLLRSRNINAPVPATGLRPYGDVGNIFQYESSGVLNQNQFMIGINSRFTRAFSAYARYSLNKASSDTDGLGSFPQNQYDLAGEYGRSSLDIRHRFYLGGNVSAPWGLRFSPFLTASSGRPFNITIGRDINGDTLFTDRPAFAVDLTKPGVVLTRFGAFDPNPTPDQLRIPRNYGSGPAHFTVNMRISKTVGFGGVEARRTQQPGGEGQGVGGRGMGGGGGRRGGGGMGGGRGGRGGFGRRGGGDSNEPQSRYNVTFSLQIQNVLNHTNLGTPVGNISSPLFGISNSSGGSFGFGGGGGGMSAGNRRVEAQVRFSF